MSTTIDQQVVELRFDNKQFESSVSSTMSTLDKLKQSLNFRGSGKGLESLSTTANSVGSNMKQLEYNACEAGFSFRDVWLKVSNVFEYQVAGKIINAGKRMISALTIDPIKAGLDEYETKMGSIQTILANTSHQGTTLDDVTAALNELNTYSDKTIYNFQEMARNIGTFTAAGIDLDTSVKSIQGIANLAAVSGSTSQQASTAMYQLSQALSAGTVKLMDWNSVVNAGMGGKVFQDALIRTAAMLDGSAKDVEAWQKEHIDAHGSFRESLSKEQWLTSEVLTTTLEQFTMSAKKGSDEWNAFKKTLMDKGYAEDQAEAILEMANTATNAATKVKTFSQLFDTLKETAQSGWAQTWELIIGDFEEAKEFLTGLSDMIGGFIDGMSKWRNNLLGDALNSNLDKLTEKLRGDGISSTQLEEKLRAVAKESGYTDERLDELINTHGSLAKAFREEKEFDIFRKALAALGIGTSGTNKSIAGFVEGLKKVDRVLRWWSIGDDVKAVQTALEALGHSVGKHGIDGIIGPDTTAAIKEFQKVAGIKIDGVVGPETLKALIDAGVSLETISKNALEADASYEDLITNIAQLGGREMLLQGFSNIVNGIVGTLRAFGAAWNEIFPASGAHAGLVKTIDAFFKFSQAFKVFDTETDEKTGETIIKFTETGEKLIRVFKGLLAIVDIFLTVVGGPFKFLLKTATQLLGYFGIGILDGAATLGDALVKLRDFIDATLDFTIVFDKIVPPIKKAFNAFREWIKSLKDSKDLPKDIAEGIVNGFSKAFKAVKKFFTSIPKLFKNGFDGLTNNPLAGFIEKLWNGVKIAGQVFVELGKMALEKINEFLSARGFKTISVDMIAGLINGIKGGIGKVLSTIGELAKSLIEKVEDILGIASPSKVFIAIGGFIIAGLAAGLLGGIPEVRTVIDKVTGKITEGLNAMGNTDLGKAIKTINWDKLFSTALAAGLLYILKKFTDGIGGFASAFEGAGEIMERAAKPIAQTIKNFAKVTKNFGKVLGSIAFEKKTEGIKNIAVSLALVLGAIVATVVILKKFDIKPGDLWHVVGLVTVLGLVLIGLSFAVAKLSGTTVDISKNGAKLASNGPKLMGIAMALLIVAGAVALLGNMDEGALKQGLIATGAIVGGLIVFLAAYGLLVKGKSAQNMDKLGKMLRKMATTLLLLVVVVKLVGLLTPDEMWKGLAFVAAFTVFVLGLTAISRLAGKKVDKIGGMVLKLSFAMLLLIGVVKLASKLSLDEMGKGALFAAGFAVFVWALVGITKIGKEQTLAKVGGLVLSMSFALLLMVGVVKLIGLLSPDEMWKGLAFVAAFAVFVWALVGITKIGSDQQIAKVSGMMISMAVAIGLLAGICVVLGLIDPDVLLKGGLAIIALGAVMTAMIWATRGANDVKGSIYAMVAAIAVLVAGLVVLTLLDTTKLIVAAIALGGVLLALAFAFKMINGMKVDLVSVLSMAGMVAVLGGVLFLLGQLDWKSSLAAAGALSVTMFVLVGCLSLMSTIPKVEETVLLSLAATVGILGLVLFILGNLPLTGAIVAAAALSVTLLALVAAMSIMSTIPQISPAVIVSLLAMTAAIAVIGTIMSLLGDMGGSDIAMSLLAIGAALAILAVGLNVMNGTISGSLALLIAVGALALLVPVLQQLSAVSWADIAKGLIIIAGAFAILGVAGLLLGPLAPVILALAGAFLMIGAATALLGIGLQAIATGFQNLATSVSENGAAFVSGMTVIITGLIALIPTVVAAIAQGLLTLIQTIATFIPAIADTAAKLVTSILETIAKYLPKIVKAGVEIIVGFIEGITKGLPKIIQAAIELVIAFINGLADGIRNNSDKVIAAVGNLVTAILGALGKVLGKVLKIGGDLAKKLGSGIKSGISKVVSIVKDMCTKLINKIKEFAKKFVEAGKDLVNGLVKGIKNIVPNAIKAVKNLGSSALKAICKVLGIKSPSREFMSIGEYSVEGFVKGLTDNSYLATGASASIGEDALESFKSVFSNSNGSINLGDLFASGTATTAQIEGMQTALNTLLGTDLEVDGVIGPKTKAAIEQFQKEYGLEITGTLNEETIKATQAALEERNRLLKQAELEQTTLLHEQRIDVETRLTSDNEKTKRQFADMIQSELVKYDELMGGAYADGVPTINQLVKIDWTAVSSGDFSSLADLGIQEFLDPAEIQKIADNYIERAHIEEIVLESLANTWTPEMAKQYASLPEESKQAYADQIQKTIDDIFKSTVHGIGDAPALLEGNEAQYQAVLENYFTELFKDMETDGKHVAEGYAKGIEKGMPAVTSAVKKLTSITVNTTTRELAIHSPSRVFRNLGKFIPEGFAQGITSLSSVVGKSTSNMASVAVKGTSNAISKIVDTINSDIDTQPTIRPVLDLTDVEAGASMIGGMFGLNPSVGVLANVGSISASMNNRQNRSNEDVVTAIDKLRKDLSDMPRSTTTIGNITYDDGTNINTAVETLVRAARIGRRR